MKASLHTSTWSYRLKNGLETLVDQYDAKLMNEAASNSSCLLRKYINRDAKHFGFILDCIRNQELPRRKVFKYMSANEESVSDLLDDAKYYKLTDLADFIAAHWNENTGKLEAYCDEKSPCEQELMICGANAKCECDSSKR